MICKDAGSKTIRRGDRQAGEHSRCGDSWPQTSWKDNSHLKIKLADQRPSLYLDLKLDTDRAKLDDPARCLLEHSDKLIVLDEIHRVPELFGALRDVIVTNRRNGRRQRTMQVDTHRCSELNVTLKIGWG